MPTIREVAIAAGVSPSTVSNVFIGQVPVREATRRRVLAVAEDLGYHPHGPAQTLRTGRSRTLALCLPFTTNPTMAALIQGASKQAYTAGFTLTICAVENEGEAMRVYLEVLARQRVAAVIAFAAGGDLTPYLPLRRAGIPLIALFRGRRGISCDLVTPNYREGTQAATRHLLEAGRRRIAILTGRTTVGTYDDRIRGYTAAFAEASLPVPDGLVCHGLDGGAGAREAIERLLACPDRPDALIVGEAALTIGALGALRDHDVKIPAEMAFIGTGDMEWARLFQPPLSMIEIHAEEMGRRAVDMALERIRPGAEDLPPRTVTLPVGLTLRQSSSA